MSELNAPQGATQTAVSKPKYRNDLTAERVRELLDYNPETGVFTWRVDRHRRVKVGDRAGCVHTDKKTGYQWATVGVDGYLYKAARLAWLHHFGEWPDGEVDHISASSLDDRIANLRSCTHAENVRNTKLRRDNTTGRKGVSRVLNKFLACIRIGGKRINLGTFSSIGQAAEAYATAAKELHGDFARWN